MSSGDLGFTGPSWQAGSAYSQVGAEDYLHPDLIPEVPDLESQYRWLANVGFQWGGRGPVYYRTVEVISDENLTREEIEARALLNGVDVLEGTDPKRGEVVTGSAVLTHDVFISWAARR